jgi:preprotein translocase SecE subunit
VASGQKPRIRKSAPTVRQRAEKAKAENPKPQRIKKVATAAASPVKKLHLPDNGLTRPIKSVGRFLKKVLGWLVPKYIINSWREVRLVVWPSRKETWRLTGAVFIFAIVFGALVAGVDKILDMIFKSFVIK